MIQNLKVIGKACKSIRMANGITQKQLGKITGYSDKTISSFETGRVNNAILLLWYLENGLTLDKIKGVE